MGLFSRRRDDATTDSDESVLGRDLGDEALDEAAASGPWDLSEPVSYTHLRAHET